jgi:hypothetical protein
MSPLMRPKSRFRQCAGEPDRFRLGSAGAPTNPGTSRRSDEQCVRQWGRTAIANGEGVLALKDREGQRSHTLSPRPANRTARLKGGDPLVGSRHGRRGTDWSVARRSTVAFHSSRLPLLRSRWRNTPAQLRAGYLCPPIACVNPDRNRKLKFFESPVSAPIGRSA